MAVEYNSKKLFYDEWAYKVRLKMPTGYNQYIKTLLRYTKDSTVENIKYCQDCLIPSECELYSVIKTVKLNFYIYK